jgi:hypothetical protein
MHTEKEENKKQNGTCLIANPIYDTVFKKLMENNRIAKFFISTILKEEVVSVVVCPQEFTYKKEKDKPTDVGYSIFRLDFMATIKTKQGENKKILIEVQKSWDESDLTRFRSYLGEQYTRTEIIDGQETVLPIIVIYVLGFNLEGVPYASLRCGRFFTELQGENIVSVKSKFIECTNHDSYIIQTKRIKDARCRSRLDELLSLFEQDHFIWEKTEIGKEYLHQSEDEDIQLITSVLQEMIADPKEREEIEKEAEALRIIDNLFGKTNRKQKKELEEQKKELKQKDKELEKKDKELEEQKKELKEQKKELEEQKKEIKEQKKELKQKDKEIEKLREDFGEVKKSFTEQTKVVEDLQKLMEEILRNQKK